MLQRVKASLQATTTPIIQAPRFIPTKHESLDLTREVLAKFLAIPKSPMERVPDDSRLKFLREKAEGGVLIPFRWAIAKILSTGEEIRVNGQHSGLMLDSLGELLPKGLRCTIEHYEVKDYDEFALLFQQFDPRQSARKDVDISGVYQCAHPELVDIDRQDAKLALDGYIWFQKQIEGVHGVQAGATRYSLFSDSGLYDYIRWIHSFHEHPGKSREYRFAQVAAAQYATFAANENAARTFWDEARKAADSEEDTEPAVVLGKWLLGLHEGTVETPDKWKAAFLYQGCVFCWNASREDRKVQTVRYEIKKNTPLSVRG